MWKERDWRHGVGGEVLDGVLVADVVIYAIVGDMLRVVARVRGGDVRDSLAKRLRNMGADMVRVNRRLSCRLATRS